MIHSIRSRAVPLLLAAALNACGGGSADSASDQQSNRSPRLVNAATDQQLTTGHAFVYDVSQGGTAVTDPDGDPLIYQLRVNQGDWGYELPTGLTINGTVISGTPTESGISEIEVQVDDGRGGTSVFFRFFLRIAENSAPQVVNPNAPQVITAGAPVNYDALQGGTTFSDADGDALTYSITLRGDPQELNVSGTSIAGTVNQIGAVEVILEASDHYGGVGQDMFLIAAAAPELSALPTLPVVPYIYRDEDLPLPYVYRLSSESVVPLWDTQPADNRTTNAGATLGRVLFYDKRLSITNTVSCATCHVQGRGFASSQRFDTGVLGIPLTRNSMALANARYSIAPAWFSDMRVRDDLRDLIFIPIDNHDELGMAAFDVEDKLQNAAFYPPLFVAAFGTADITRARIAAALAQFVQSLISYQAKIDLAENPMTNEAPKPEDVLNASELRGLEIYNDNCAICHEVHAGTNVWQANIGLDSIPSDPGVLDEALRRDGSLGIFRSASLRNIAVSGPYMHDGRFSTLREVIDHYDHGVMDGPYLDSLLRDLSGQVKLLNLSEEDKNDLENFLNTFTDDAFLSDPKFSDPFPP